MVSGMYQFQDELVVATHGQGLHEITGQVLKIMAKSAIRTGQLTLFIRHSSASLMIQENADPDVRRDLVEFFRRIAPENADWITHTAEGPDDMPAHIKSALTQVSLTIPVIGGQPALGSWQGIYLFEHRLRPHRRQILVHVIGE
ncbi:secondary thiamine-phosphate synthase enzyme YjbQ [Taklimakanibacter lacteus]|uniref:secondary thiamine-phosphate synthase enzyme YjbQ n=1 Tax=Taklimakanibacter lacteus TaxID=2268456 RepID=UPI0034D3F917